MDAPIVSTDAPTYPNMSLTGKLYRYDLLRKRGQEDEKLRDEIISLLIADSMEPLYRVLIAKYAWISEVDNLDAMRSANNSALQLIEQQHDEAGKTGGDSDVLDAMFAKARTLTKIGDWIAALAAFDEILQRPNTSTGKKIDATMEKARIALFVMDIKKLKDLIAEVKKLIDAGGDWDRRNRLKVYEALLMLILRDFSRAATLFLDGIATFTCVELCSYEQFIFYAIISCLSSLSRPDLHKKLITNPHVIAVVRDFPDLQLILNSLYRCEYGEFFRSLTLVYPSIANDRYVGPHSSYLIREYRILAYAQFLEAYRSVMMSSMAKSFGISLSLLDEELSRFVAAGRLHAKIDKVGDVVETCRPDAKNAQYQEVIKKGDGLLNHIQRLIRVVDV